jgi:AGCS family alanine or glycine:cation symporter
LVIIGGVKKIALASSVIAPFMALFYVGVGLFIIITNFDGLAKSPKFKNPN